jgi:anti-sigma regulatory factor (Ser/Thr protein kinase)
MPDVKSFTTAARTGNFDEVREFILAACENAPLKSKHQIAIAADEIFTNISSYAYTPETGEVNIRVYAEDGAVTIEFEDAGVPYNPMLQKEPDLSADEDKRTKGGLGIFIVKKLMDKVAYRREGNKNILSIRKKLC